MRVNEQETRTLTVVNGVVEGNEDEVLITTRSSHALFVEKVADYTASTTEDMIACDASGGALTITLPAASGLRNRVYVIKKVDETAYAVTVAANEAELIDGEASWIIDSPYTSMTLVCDGAGWNIV